MTRSESELVMALIGRFRLNGLSINRLGKLASAKGQEPQSLELNRRLGQFIESRAAEIERAELSRLDKAH
jgi:hypothetical protein